MKYRIIGGAENMKLEDIRRLLKMTYWADKRSPETVEKSVKNASCYGVFLDDVNKLAGFARVISDYATTFYLADVIIDAGDVYTDNLEQESRAHRGPLVSRTAHEMVSAVLFWHFCGFSYLSGTP